MRDGGILAAVRQASGSGKLADVFHPADRQTLQSEKLR